MQELPWEPLLTDEEVQRGQGYYGSGTRLRRVAAKLLVAAHPAGARLIEAAHQGGDGGTLLRVGTAGMQPA